MPKSLVAFGMLGVTLDRGKAAKRWEVWRPTISLCSHEDLLIDRLVLLHQSAFKDLADQVVGDLHLISPETEVQTYEIELEDPWDFEKVYGALLDFADSYPFNPEREDYLVHMTTGTHVAQICLYLLTEANYFPARLIQTAPPRKRGDGPGNYSIIDLDLSKYDQIAARFRAKEQEDLSFLKSGIETKNRAFNRLIQSLEKVALASKQPILLGGRTGVGKSRLARRIFELKKRRRQVEGSLVELNCATLRGDAAMSTLFGHVRGAFTGAQNARKGMLAAADRGVLFLDEIGELGLDEQAMLLRAIEQKSFFPVGSDKEVAVDFQLLAGTNRDLRDEVRKGTFREDLLARINLWTFELPSLSSRPEDIEPNLNYELASLEQELGYRVSFNQEARKRFLSFAKQAPWTGNFRDFHASILRMATLCGEARIGVKDVNEETERLEYAWSGQGEVGASPSLVDSVLREQASSLDRFDRAQLEEVLKVCRASANMSEAGRILFAVSRTQKRSRNDSDRLRKYLARFDLEWDRASGR